MDAIKFLKEKSRMTKKCSIHCADCPLGSEKNTTGFACGDLQREYPEIVVNIVEKWSAEHPQKTLLQDFLEKYPKALIEDGAFPAACPFQLGYETESEKDINAYCESTARDSCRRCWNRLLEEVENNG
jgi:hypothetical protein